MKKSYNKSLRREYISLLLKIVILSVLLSSALSADTGLVFPDTAQMSFAWSVNNDTITIVILNQSATPVADFFFTEHTSSPITLIECLVDASPSLPDLTDKVYNSVYPNEYTTRFVIHSFSNSVILKYYPFSYNFSFCAGTLFPIFGVPRNVGPPNNLRWVH